MKCHFSLVPSFAGSLVASGYAHEQQSDVHLPSSSVADRSVDVTVPSEGLFSPVESTHISASMNSMSDVRVLTQSK
jgi:hypothetical protein